MNASDTSNDELDSLLRAHAPAPLDDDDFVARTLAAVALASHSVPARRRATASPREIARALVSERRRYAAHARLRRWGVGGVATGIALLLVAMITAPGGANIDVGPDAALLVKLWTVLAIGALWHAWREFRAA